MQVLAGPSIGSLPGAEMVQRKFFSRVFESPERGTEAAFCGRLVARSSVAVRTWLGTNSCESLHPDSRLRPDGSRYLERTFIGENHFANRLALY